MHIYIFFGGFTVLYFGNIIIIIFSVGFKNVVLNSFSIDLKKKFFNGKIGHLCNFFCECGIIYENFSVAH